MLFTRSIKTTLLTITLIFAGLIIPKNASAHCDSMDGPVILAAQKALEAKDVNLVLIWVNEEQEDQIRKAFKKTQEIRNVSEEVREMADMYFFETLVRLHRESEGAAYTGLKPAGTDFGPVIPAGDNALETGSLDELKTLITTSFEKRLNILFESMMDAKNFNPENIEAGREFVHKYVEFMHYAEPVYEVVLGANPAAHAH